MKALDLFCCAGGMSVGLERAGFDVTGVDINPQPHHRGGRFLQADALEVLLDLAFLRSFDFIHASPPCQAHSCTRVLTGRRHLDLIPVTRERLLASGVPYTIENVPGAPLVNPALVCGLALGLGVKRHRLFESSFLLFGTHCPAGHPGQWVSVYGHGKAGVSERYRSRENKRGFRTLQQAQQAMGIDWMNRNEICQAIPPVYGEWIGRQALAYLA